MSYTVALRVAQKSYTFTVFSVRGKRIDDASDLVEPPLFIYGAKSREIISGSTPQKLHIIDPTRKLRLLAESNCRQQ